jgi:hypothetical protein
MKTKNYYANCYYIKWNNNDLKSVKKAEKQKAIFENKGYILRHQMINHITGDCTFTYHSNKK